MAVISNEPKVIATSRYSINETCELLGITRKTLQKYTVFGLIKCGFRKATMKKFYTGLEIMKFWRTAV
nr:DNA-binding protein [uncultured Prevotella sp.]